jgi:hypothetical protein
MKKKKGWEIRNFRENIPYEDNVWFYMSMLIGQSTDKIKISMELSFTTRQGIDQRIIILGSLENCTSLCKSK